MDFKAMPFVKNRTFIEMFDPHADQTTMLSHDIPKRQAGNLLTDVEILRVVQWNLWRLD